MKISRNLGFNIVILILGAFVLLINIIGVINSILHPGAWIGELLNFIVAAFWVWKVYVTIKEIFIYPWMDKHNKTLAALMSSDILIL